MKKKINKEYSIRRKNTTQHKEKHHETKNTQKKLT